MHPPPLGQASRPLPQQEAIPDAAGLEPSAEGPAASLAPARLKLSRSGKGPLAKTSRRSWVDKPISIATIMTLATPSVIEQLVSASIGFTDTIVAGHTGGSEHERAAAAAAVSAMTYLQWFAGLMTATLAVGATAIVARSIGSGRPRIANRVAGTACSAGFVLGLLVAVIFYVAARPLVWSFRFQDQAAEFAVQYLRIMCWTICFQTVGQIGTACLRGAGDMVRPLAVTIAISIVNGFASPALTFGWFGLRPMGIQGNALGTLLAFGVSGAVTMGFLLYGDGGLKLRLRHLRIVPHLLTRISRIGVPSWIEGMLLWGGQIAVVMLVMQQVDQALGKGSGVTMAAHGASLRIEGLAYLPGYGFGIACSALVGQYLGARKPEEAERSAVLCNKLAMITMIIAAIPMVLLPRQLIRLLVDSSDVVATGTIPLIFAGLAQPAFAYAIVKSSALKGAGDTVSPMVTTLLGMGSRVIVVLVTMAILQYTGHAAWGLVAVWICIFLDLGFRGLAMEIVFRRGKWKLLKV